MLPSLIPLYHMGKKKKIIEGILSRLIILCLTVYSKKEQRNGQLFNLSNHCSKNLMEGKKPRIKGARFSILLLDITYNTNTVVLL